VRWEYEPRTFVLERDGDRIVEACTPDFFLPELGIYIECTVAEQRYTNRKRRKIRTLRERFGLIAHEMYRQDVLRLGRRHGLRGLERVALQAKAATRRRRRAATRRRLLEDEADRAARLQDGPADVIERLDLL
jgi:hypothetical protein